MKIIEISDYNKFINSKTEWEDLLSRSKVDNIFLTHEWIDSCIKYFYANEKLLILNIFNGNNLVGIAPLVIKKGGYFGLPVKTVSFIGTSISDRMDFILDGDKKEIIKVIFDHLMSIKKEWDLIDLQELSEYAGNLEYVESYIKEKGFINIIGPVKKSFFIDFDKDKDFFVQKFSKKLESRLKKIKNKGISLNLEFQRHTNGDINADEIFLKAQAIEDKSWKGKKQSGIFSKDNTRSFHREILGKFSRNKWIDFSILALDKEPVAYIYNYLYGGRSYNYSVAFDKKHSVISAGTMLMLWALKESGSRGISEFDFARGEDSWKTKLTQNFREHNRIRIFKDEAYSRVLHMLQSRIMPCFKNIKILHSIWVKIKDILKWE